MREQEIIMRESEITIQDYRLVFLSRRITTISGVHFGGKILKMAEQLSAEDLTEFFDSLRRTIERATSVYCASDIVGLEVCERRLEEQTRLLIAISPSKNSPPGDLFEVLEVSLAALLRNISDVLNAASCHPKGTTQLALSKSTGGRPAYNITKEMIEQLRETGMNWTSIATCLGISDQTLYRRRIEFGVENNFTEITNEELDRQIQETLNLTPYSGEIYVRGSLKGRGINVQRFRIRESLNRIDGIGRAVRRQYAIC